MWVLSINKESLDAHRTFDIRETSPPSWWPAWNLSNDFDSFQHWDDILDGLKHVDCMYLDFSKVFDKVETIVLLHYLRDAKLMARFGAGMQHSYKTMGVF